MSPLHLSVHPFPKLANETLPISISHLEGYFLSWSTPTLSYSYFSYKVMSCNTQHLKLIWSSPFHLFQFWQINSAALFPDIERKIIKIRKLKNNKTHQCSGINGGSKPTEEQGAVWSCLVLLLESHSWCHW